MKFKCPACHKIIKRDMRIDVNKAIMTSRGFKSYCQKYGKVVFAKKVKQKK